MRILEIVMLVGFPIGLIAGVIGSIILTVYQFIEARRVEKMFASIKSYDSQRDAIYKTWGDKHSIMPYAGPDVGWFIGSCGFGIPMGISIVATSIVALIYYVLR